MGHVDVEREEDGEDDGGDGRGDIRVVRCRGEGPLEWLRSVNKVVHDA
jgi:hypothetical protein